MPHWKQNFDYRFTGAYELQPGEEKTVKIVKTGHDEVADQTGKKQTCFVAYFEGQSKPMVLNKTNCKTIAKLYGEMIENWNGKLITLFATKVKAFGEEVEALRIKPIKPKDKTFDSSKAQAKLNECKSLDELQMVYMSLSADEKAATLNLKDKLKTILK